MEGKRQVRFIRKNFVAGAIVIIPIWVTILLVKALVDLFDSTFALFPAALQPKTYISFAGIEILIAFAFILVVGILANNIIGNRLVGFGERILSKIPLVRTIYHAVKHLTTGIVGDKKIFSQVVMLESPITGLKFIGFVTGEEKSQISQSKTTLLKVFIPTTPNPTSGFLCFAPMDNVEKLNISVEEAFKLIISAGYVNQETQ
jgi:uncharacterized membrane protein